MEFEARAREGSSANLFQGEAGSVGVEELHQNVQSLKRAPPRAFSLCSFWGKVWQLHAVYKARTSVEKESLECVLHRLTQQALQQGSCAFAQQQL